MSICNLVEGEYGYAGLFPSRLNPASAVRLHPCIGSLSHISGFHLAGD
jgi:hypothetical protein